MFKTIPLTKGYYAKVDEDDYLFLSKYKWHVSIGSSTGTRPYARGRIDGKSIYMHKLVLNCPIGKVVDHLNNDSLDNRKINLEAVTPYENMRRVKAFEQQKFKKENRCYE